MGTFKPRASARPMAALRVQFMADKTQHIHASTSQTDDIHPDLLGEHLYISACIDEGYWNPRKDGLGERDFVMARDLFRHIDLYTQHSGGQMPPLNLLRSSFPDLVYVHGVNHGYAVDRLTTSNGIRTMLREMRKTTTMLKSGDFDQAVEYMGTVTRGLKRTSAGHDLRSIESDLTTEALPSLYEPLQQAGGLQTGYYVVVAGRPGDGKSWRLMQHAVDMARAGKHVIYFSLEMSAPVCANRMHHLMFGERAYQMEWKDRARAVGEWLDEHGGRITIKDPGDGSVTPLTVARSCEPGEIAVIDYLGLMSSSGGSKSIEDWRAAALISNELRIVSLADNVTVVAGVQLNRGAGDTPRSNPTLALLSQSDAIGQDADLAVVLRKPAPKVTVNHVVKSRHGITGGKWFTKFEPMIASLAQISLDEALDIINEDKGAVET